MKKRGRGDCPLKHPLPLADEIPAATRPHPRRVHRASSHVAPFACPIRVALALHRQRHLPVQDNVRRLRAMCVIRIRRVGPVLPHISMAEALPLKLNRQLLLVHSIILANKSTDRAIWSAAVLPPLSRCKRYLASKRSNETAAKAHVAAADFRGRL